MKSLLSFLLLTIGIQSFSQDSVEVDLDVRTIMMQYVMDYAHPINHTYTIRLSNLDFRRKIRKKTKGFMFVNPQEELTNSVNDVTANGLVYYIRPSSQLLVTIDDSITDIDEMNEAYWRNEDYMKKSLYQKLVQRYFQPFYIRESEVTNAEYIEFMDWVKDSVIRETLYASDLLSDEEASKLLKTNKVLFDEDSLKWIYFDPKNRAYNRRHYSFNYAFNYRKKITSDLVNKITTELYEGKRIKVFNPEKLVYQYTDTKEGDAWRIHRRLDSTKKCININPGTPINTIEKTGKRPVVSVTWEQAKAFIAWKQQQFQNAYPEIADHFEFDLPKIYEFEQVAKKMGAEIMNYESIVPDLLLTKKVEKVMEGPYIVSEWLNEDYETYYRKIYSHYCQLSGIRFNDSTLLSVMKYENGRLIMGQNWVNVNMNNGKSIYQKTFRAKNHSFLTVGFRYVLRLKPVY